jgi:putative ABC transport system permease protein
MMSIAVSRVLSNMLFGVKATDASTYAEILLIVLPVIVLTAALPALRAAHVDPMIALREE